MTLKIVMASRTLYIEMYNILYYVVILLKVGLRRELF